MGVGNPFKRDRSNLCCFPCGQTHFKRPIAKRGEEFMTIRSA